jgi:hypothetical protein
MLALFFAVHMAPGSRRCTYLLRIGDAERGRPNPKFDPTTELILSTLQVDFCSAQRHPIDGKGVQLWTYRVGPPKASGRHAIFALIGHPFALGPFFYRRLSFDEFTPQHWLNAAA